MTDRLTVIERDLHQLKDECARLRAAQPLHVSVISLEPEPYELLRDIPIVVQADDDSYVATFFDANVNASGDTQTDAVANLKDVMIGLFEALQKQEKLGKGPATQLAVLQTVMRRKV